MHRELLDYISSCSTNIQKNLNKITGNYTHTHKDEKDFMEVFDANLLCVTIVYQDNVFQFPEQK